MIILKIIKIKFGMVPPNIETDFSTITILNCFIKISRKIGLLFNQILLYRI